jgi:AraC-like DNA-binding protein
LGDAPTALEHRQVDLVVLAGCSGDTGWERTARGIRSTRGDPPLVVLRSDRGQDALVSALVGTAPRTATPNLTPEASDEPGTLLPHHIAGAARRAALTPTLSLLEPTPRPVSADLQRAVSFIELHYAEPISLADAARAASYSRCHFCKLFKQQLGLSFVSYLSQVRIRHARDLLTRSHLSITEIALEVGFNDLSHFERVFRSLQRQSPSQFRQIAKESP